MKASELRPGQFFEWNCIRYRALYLPGFWCCYMDKDFQVYTCLTRDTDVIPLVVTGWDDEPQSEHKLPEGFTPYDGTGKPDLPDDTLVEFCLRNDEGKPTDVTNVGGLGWSWDDEDYSPGGDVIGYRIVADHIADAGKKVDAPLQLREGAWYRRRDLELTGPCESWPHTDYKWKCGKHTYTDEGTFWMSKTASRHDLIAEVPPPEPVCHICGKPATCHGTYESMTGYSCDDCCGHGCEDGFCRKLESLVDPQPEQFKAGDWVVWCPETATVAAEYVGLRSGVAYEIKSIREDGGVELVGSEKDSWHHPFRFRRATPAEVAAYKAEHSSKVANAIVSSLDELAEHLRTQPDADGWIEHDGKGTPGVGLETLVEVRFRNESTAIGRVDNWSACWYGDHENWDIVAYRLAKPQLSDLAGAFKDEQIFEDCDSKPAPQTDWTALVSKFSWCVDTWLSMTSEASDE